jgi:uncharacterized protein with PIN domain
MIAADTSAIVAIIQAEPECKAFLSLIRNADRISQTPISPPHRRNARSPAGASARWGVNLAQAGFSGLRSCESSLFDL